MATPLDTPKCIECSIQWLYIAIVQDLQNYNNWPYRHGARPQNEFGVETLVSGTAGICISCRRFWGLKGEVACTWLWWSPQCDLILSYPSGDQRQQWGTCANLIQVVYSMSTRPSGWFNTYANHSLIANKCASFSWSKSQNVAIVEHVYGLWKWKCLYKHWCCPQFPSHLKS